MKYFFDPVLGVRAFESDGSQDFLITPLMRPLTQKEVEAHLNPESTPYERQQELNANARAYLASTDWYVIRLQETGEPIPNAVLQERAAARARVVD